MSTPKRADVELCALMCAECGSEIKRNQRQKIRFMKDRKRSIMQTIHHNCDRVSIMAKRTSERINCLSCRKVIAKRKGGRKRIYTDRYDAALGLEVSGFVHLKCARPSERVAV